MTRFIPVLLLSGCATIFGAREPNITLPHQQEAIAMIWKSYGRTDTPPAVVWRTGDGLNCTSPRGHLGFKALTTAGEACVAGQTLSPATVEVAYVEGDRLGDTSLAHELLHARWLRDWVGDPNHKLPWLWGAGGMLEQANTMLAAEGW